MRSLIAWSACLMLTLAACGGDDGGSADTTQPGDTVTDTAAETTQADTAQPDIPFDPGTTETGVIEVTTDTATDQAEPEVVVVEHYDSCGDLFFQCVMACDDEGDDTCETTCAGKAEPAAAAAMAAVGACFEASCTDMPNPEDYIDCLGSADLCGTAFHDCLGGTGICKTIRGCWLEDCEPGDHECALGCMRVGNAQAMNDFTALYLCIWEICGGEKPEDFEACYLTAAGRECINHSNFCSQD